MFSILTQRKTLCNNTNMKLLGWLAALLGIVLLIIAGVYIVTPAHSLPHFFPGYDAHIARAHLKHAVASVCLAAACFAFAWFNTGKKSSKE